MLANEVLYTVETGLLLLAFCVLFGPWVAERARIPGLVGLIAVGMLLGPDVLHWLRPGGFVATVGSTGLLFLMFVAGLELDMKTFLANRNAALTFGVLTFVVPFSLSYVVGVVYLDLGASAAALVGAMWASHTIVAYPEAKAAGLDRNRAVGSAVASTVITDVLALVILALASSSSALDEAPEVVTREFEDPHVPLVVGLLLMVGFCFGVLPKLTRWMFVNVWHTRTQRFVWLLLGMSAGAVIGLVGGIEGLVGAFLAGLGMNASVPARSELMERVEFLGSSLLVPAFLVSVGLSIDPAALVEPATLRLAAIFTALVVVGKSVAAVAAGRLFRFERGEVAMMAALTIGQAAATLAIAQVGVGTGLFDQEILNAAVVTVVATVLITSFGTRLAARHIAPPEADANALGEHVLVVAPRSGEVVEHAAVASALTAGDGGLVTPVALRRTQDADADGRGDGGAARQLTALADALTRLGHDTHGIERLADSVPHSVRQISVEQQATFVLIPLPARALTLGLGVGNHVDAIGRASHLPCAALLPGSSPWSRIVVFTGATRAPDVRHQDVVLVAEMVRRLHAARPVPVEIRVRDAADAEPFAAIPGVTSAVVAARSASALEGITAGDLVVVPAHVVADAGAVGRARLHQALGGAGVMVVAGPGRLRVSMLRLDRPFAGAVTRKPDQGEYDTKEVESTETV